MPYFENQGANLYYEVTGSGNPLIFLHGASWDMHQWDHEVAHFSLNFQVITIDARGHGKSSLPSGPISPTVFWKDVVSLMNHLNLPKAVLCGLSFGGHVALQVAIHAKERVEGIIVIGAICTNQFSLFEKIALPINRFSLKLMPMRWIAWSIAVGIGNFNPDSKSYVLKTVGSLDHKTFHRVWMAITSMECQAELPKITCPTLILLGDHDRLTRRQQPYMQEHIKNSQLKIIENANHGTNLDNPQQVQKEIECFLSKRVHLQ